MSKSTDSNAVTPVSRWLPCPAWCRVDHDVDAVYCDENYRSHRGKVAAFTLTATVQGRCEPEKQVKVGVWRPEDHEEPADLTRQPSFIELVAPCDTSGSLDTSWWTPSEARLIAHALLTAVDMAGGAA